MYTIKTDTNQSVLNTDKYDQRGFKKLYAMSKGLQNLNEFEQPFPTYESLLSDIWAGLYKVNPKLKELEIVSDYLYPNHSLMQRMMDDENFHHFREYTRLDDLSSAIGTVQLGKKTKEWLQEEQHNNNELNKTLKDIERMQRQLKQQEQDNGVGNGNESLQADLQKLLANLHEQIDKALRDNHIGFGKAMKQAMQDTQDTRESVKSLMGGTKAGSGEAELKKVPLRDQLKLADKMEEQKKMKEIADWAGRFKQIARKKQKNKHNKATTRSGITLGNNLERVLPSELAMYKNEATKMDFLRLFSKQKTRQYDAKGKDTLGKGPFILCLDQSGSMNNLDSQSKGFALALMSIAKRQKRDFALIPFSSKAYKYLYKKGKIEAKDMVDLCERFIGGGTNFEAPLGKALEVINESSFKKADIVFVTDGEASVTESFINDFQKQKQRKEFNVLSLIIGYRSDTVNLFSKKIIQINNFHDEGTFTAFEI
ncbi:VWA domain-containing protein [Oceanobacillus damuensis]|uniref:VWA domain-containing protein n=1 Tax=Oceanobacillus damuensis TaxID=937928 RepID=UPI000836272A|nr:VWA domain-containing protein [Oceanobacillus damuensis]